MANPMKLIAKESFPKAIQVTERFHMQKISFRSFTGDKNQIPMGSDVQGKSSNITI